MALWGNSDNVTSAGTVWLNYATGIVTATGTAFGAAGSAQEGDVIRFGNISQAVSYTQLTLPPIYSV